MRVAAAVLVAWFGVLFVALGLHATKVGAPGWTVVGFNLAAVLGVVGLVVLLTRRAGAGGALIASMLILGQVVAVVSLF